MSVCISTHGEYSAHQPDGDHVCTLCGVLDLYREALKDWTPSRGMAAGTGFHTERSWE